MQDINVSDRADTVPQRELPRYKCHKEVWALKIKAIEQAPAQDEAPAGSGGTWLLIPEDAGYGPVRVPHVGYFEKHKPQVGGYYVVYDDGYKSYSPAAPFESGYALIRAPYQQRVIDEKEALDEKLNKLLAFTSASLFATLPAEDQQRMREQAQHMQAYSNVLGVRIAAF